MKRKTALLILNPRSTDGFGKVPAILAVLSAAGWKTDTAMNEYGGHVQRLAKKAAEDGYDLVIGFGGDGTLNQVVNGVMTAKRRRCTVAVIPSGTANVWAQELDGPVDPIKAALLLVNSLARKVDLGHVQIEPAASRRRASARALASKGRHHFILMAGVGLDAAVLPHISSPLRHKIGDTAVALAVAKELPSHGGFPIEIRAARVGKNKAVSWKGEALQVFVGNTRQYGGVAAATPNALIDDGMLDVCVITTGDPLDTVHQIISVLLRRGPVPGKSEYFRSARIEMTVPASVELQLDGSRVKREDALATEGDAGAGQGMITYRFDAMPRALQVAVPRTYDGELFANGAKTPRPEKTEKKAPEAEPLEEPNIEREIPDGRKVRVIAVAPDPRPKGGWLIAGETPKKKQGETKPVAVRVGPRTILVGSTNGATAVSTAAHLAEGKVLLIAGNMSKRGVIRAKRLAVLP